MAIITTRNLHYQYRDDDKGRPYALKDVNLELESGQFYAILGSTGSGKSTLLQHFNGLYQPTLGQIQVLDITFAAGQKKKGLKGLRSRVGLVFQFPEQQLFEETVEKDLMFGPIQFGSSQEEAREAARTALAEVGLPAELLERSPFELSGGQIRKVAIATVLASKPELLVLDEPTATLDPVSRKELIELLQRLRREEGRTVVMVTHRLDEVFGYADQFVLMKEGSVTFVGTKQQLMDAPERLAEAGIIEPPVMTLALEASRKTGIPARELPCQIEDWVDWLSTRDVLKAAGSATSTLHTKPKEASAALSSNRQEPAATVIQPVITGEEG